MIYLFTLFYENNIYENKEFEEFNHKILIMTYKPST